MIPQQNADFTFGAMRLVLPPEALSGPSDVWSDLTFAMVLEHDGYGEIACDQLGRIAAFLQEPQAQQEGRKLIDGVQSGDAGLSWYVARAATRREKDAEAAMVDAGFVVYLPREAHMRRKAGQKYRVETALLPGYLFVGIRSAKRDPRGHDADMAEVLGLDGVHDLVRSPGERRPLRAPFAGKSSISTLLAMEVAGDFDRARKVRSLPVKNDPVTVDGGSFQGWPARFVTMEAKDRARLLMNMFGGWTEIVLQREDVAELRDAD